MITMQPAVEVLWEDQKRINSFGRLHNRKVELLSHVRVQEVRMSPCLIRCGARYLRSLLGESAVCAYKYVMCEPSAATLDL